MSTIYIENQPYTANADQNLLHACLSLGFDLPYFCWHPALGSVGACRQCAVKQFRDEHDTKGKIVMACMTPAQEGARISIHDSEAAEFRRLVIEGLMLNHPHDCPVCDEGGECHLQDMTVMTGHNYRRSEFPKRTFRNQDMGPFVNHEMNRCIQCYRCVRFYQDYAGGRDLAAFHLHDTVFFGRFEDGPLESEFAGNLVEICPTGVFTDKTLKPHYTRKWDLEMAPSICVHCSLGCNVTAGARYGQVRRILNRYNREINGYFLCDRGRFGYEFANGPQRILHPRIADGDSQVDATREAALQRAAELVRDREVIGIGSPRASLESNFALRALAGPERFFAGVAEQEFRAIRRMIEALENSPAPIASLHDIEECDAILVLGEDIPNIAPRMALSLRQALMRQPAQEAARLGIPGWNDTAVREVIQDRRGPLFIASVNHTRLDELALTTLHAAPGDLARFGCAVANQLDASAPAPEKVPEEHARMARNAALALKGAGRPLVISGTGCHSEQVIEAAVNIAAALRQAGADARLALVAAECNSIGIGLMAAGSLDRAFEAAGNLDAPVIVTLEEDLFRRAPSDHVEALLGAASAVITLDHSDSDSIRASDVVLPAATFAEGSGTFVNHEGRAQRFMRVLPPPLAVQDSWRWLRDITAAADVNGDWNWTSLDDVIQRLASELPVFRSIPKAAPPAAFRVGDSKIARQPFRASGRTAMFADINIHEPKPPEDPDSALAFSMEGAQRQPPSALIPFFWSPGWNSIQAVNKYQTEVGDALRGGTPGVLLFEPHKGAAPYANDIPGTFEPRSDEWLLVPLYDIFGSEEASRWSPSIAQVTPEPHVWLNAHDMDKIGAHAGETIGIAQNGSRLELTAAVDDSLPTGVAGMPVGLTEPLDLPAWVKLRRQ